jgi:hypothetical protein
VPENKGVGASLKLDPINDVNILSWSMIGDIVKDDDPYGRLYLFPSNSVSSSSHSEPKHTILCHK